MSHGNSGGETFTSGSEKEEKYKMTVKYKRNLSRGNAH